MNGLIITNQTLGHNEYKIKRLLEEFNNLGVDVEVFINDGTLASIIDNEIKIKLPKASFVVYLDKDIYLAKMLESVGYRLFNKADFIKLCDDKNLTNIACANIGIKMPKTITAPLFYGDNKEDCLLTFIDTLINELNFPMVCKKVYGSLGKGVFLAHNKEELVNFYKMYCKEPLQFQEYIGTSYGKTIRVLVVDGQIIGSFMRFNDSDFRSNYGSSSTSKKYEINTVFSVFVEKISNYFGIEYAGLDLMFGKNDEPVLCEINSNAFFQEFEKVTGVNVAKLFCQMIVRKAEKHE